MKTIFLIARQIFHPAKYEELKNSVKARLGDKRKQSNLR